MPLYPSSPVRPFFLIDSHTAYRLQSPTASIKQYIFKSTTRIFRYSSSWDGSEEIPTRPRLSTSTKTPLTSIRRRFHTSLLEGLLHTRPQRHTSSTVLRMESPRATRKLRRSSPASLELSSTENSRPEVSTSSTGRGRSTMLTSASTSR